MMMNLTTMMIVGMVVVLTLMMIPTLALTTTTSSLSSSSPCRSSSGWPVCSSYRVSSSRHLLQLPIQLSSSSPLSPQRIATGWLSNINNNKYHHPLLLLSSSLSNVEDDETTTLQVVSFPTTTTAANGIVDGEKYNPGEQQQQQTTPLYQQDDYILRFAGVARLYAKEIEKKQQQQQETTNNAVATTDTSTSDSDVNNQNNNNMDESTTSCPLFESDAVMTVLQRLSEATVIIVGLGGVGSWAAEALCRSGIGHIVMIDLDDVCISNTNRQVHSMSSTVGHMKIDEMERRLHDIHPDCQISLYYDFVSNDNVHEILQSIQAKLKQTASSSSLSSPCLLCLDAMDAVPDKVALISACADLNISLVTCGGAAELTDPTRIRTADLSKVMDDSLLRSCRKLLRQEYGFERGLPFHLRRKVELLQQQQDQREDETNNGVVDTKDDEEENRYVKKYRTWNIDAVYSTEIPVGSSNNNNDSDNNESAFRRCDCAAGTACFVTGSFGFVAAGRIVDRIAKQEFALPRRK